MRLNIDSTVCVRVAWVLLVLPDPASFARPTCNIPSLASAIFRYYDLRFPPYSDRPTEVGCIPGMIRCRLDADDQILHGYYSMKLRWKDPRLSWNESEYNCKEISVPDKIVWKPDILFDFTTATDDLTAFIPPMQVRILSDGTNIWNIPRRESVSCSMETAMFPFDVQQCKLILYSYTGDTSMVKLRALGPFMSSVYENGHQYELVRTYMVAEEKKYGCCVHPFSQLSYTLVLRRKSGYYTHYVVIPCGLMCVLCILGIFTRSNSGKTRVSKISLGVTGLLNISVFTSMMSQYVPKVSDTEIPVLTWIFFGYQLLIVVAGMCSCIIAAIERRDLRANSDKELPEAFRTCLRIQTTCERARQEASLRMDDVAKSKYDRQLSTIQTLVENISSSLSDESPGVWSQLAARLERLCLLVHMFLYAVITAVLVAEYFKSLPDPPTGSILDEEIPLVMD